MITATSGVSALSRLFHFFETSYEPGFNAVSKVTANVIPRTLITRNPVERKEVLFNELTQGATLFAMLPLTSWLGQFLQAPFSGISKHLIRGKTQDVMAQVLSSQGLLAANQLKVAKLGLSLGASWMIACALVATAYLRNYRTIRRTGFSDYTQVVGLTNPKRQPPQKKQQWDEQQKAEIAKAYNLAMIKRLLTLGAVGWLGVMAGAGVLARRGSGVFSALGLFRPKRLDWLMKHWAFVGKRSDQINGPFKSRLQTLWVWGIPSFIGWFLGCRDQYEVLEQGSKFTTFLAGYIFLPRWVAAWMRRKGQLVTESYHTLIQNRVEAAQKMRLKNRQWLILSAGNLMLAGVLPLLFNIGFSKWRYLRRQHTQLQNPAGDLGYLPLRRRPGFQAWGILQSKYNNPVQ